MTLTDAALLAGLAAAHDAALPSPSSTGPGRPDDPGIRGRARALRRLVTAFACPDSRHHRDASFLDRAGTLVRDLDAAQHGDGTFSIGNLHSPPDTGFVVGDFAVVRALLRADGGPQAATLARSVEDIMVRCGPPLTAGGVHTPNHRWALCAALARIDQVDPDPAHRRRIDEWLAEGIDQDGEGQYSERSPNYAARVTNPALLVLARLLDLPDLTEYVRRNLGFTLCCLDPDGRIESIQSRRQDQDRPSAGLGAFYLQFRELALAGGDPAFAAAARLAEQRDLVSPDALGDLMERPELAAPLPEAGLIARDFITIAYGSGLVRMAHNGATVSVYGGTDDIEPAPHDAGTRARRIASGLATNPTFLRACQGRAVLDSVRMSTAYFGLGHFRAERLEVLGPGRFRLRDELRVAYHLPLPDTALRAGGAYRLGHDGRFYAQMAFDQRPKCFRRQRREVVVTDLSAGGTGSPQVGSGLDLELRFEVDGDDDGVPVTVELCFAAGGALSGVSPAGGGSPDAVLATGCGSYAVGPDRLDFGPGHSGGPIDMDPGEQYRVHQGDRPVSGRRVYLTGLTPFRHILRLRGSSAPGADTPGPVRS